MFRWVGVLILSVAMMLGYGGTALAQPLWCEDDPILHFSDGTSVHLVTSAFGATAVTYDVHVPKGTTFTVTYPASGQITSTVHAPIADLPADSATASITVTVSGGDGTFIVTQTGGGAGKHKSGSSSGTTTFSLTLGR